MAKVYMFPHGRTEFEGDDVSETHVLMSLAEITRLVMVARTNGRTRDWIEAQFRAGEVDPQIGKMALDSVFGPRHH